MNDEARSELNDYCLKDVEYSSKLELYLRAFNILRCIDYKPGWVILIDKCERGVYLQVQATTLDAQPVRAVHDVLEYRETTWKGGKRYLSPWMCRQEIVGICFDLFKAAEEHELREWFRYKDKQIYSPHLDPDWLADNLTDESINCRTNAMTMEETDV